MKTRLKNCEKQRQDPLLAFRCTRQEKNEGCSYVNIAFKNYNSTIANLTGNILKKIENGTQQKLDA